jgi:peptide deformylase
MIYPITKYGAGVLESPTKPVDKFDDELAKLCEDMFESMYVAQGVGLAATQIGLPKRLAVIDVSVGKNPEEEGCLSLPGFRGNVLRPAYVTMRAQNLKGEVYEMRGEGLLARAFCHEIDHLDGILFLQHLSMLKRDLIRRRIRKLRKTGDW